MWEHNYLIQPFNPLNTLNMPEFGHNEESFSLVAQYYLYLLYFSIYFSCSFTLIRALLSKKVAITVFSSQHNIASSNQHVVKRQDKENDKKNSENQKTSSYFNQVPWQAVIIRESDTQYTVKSHS